MARLESVASVRNSGWSLTVVREGDDFKDFTEEMLVLMREGAEQRMKRAVAYAVDRVKWMLSSVWPERRLPSGRTTRSSVPPAPPGQIEGDLIDSWKAGRVSWTKKMTVLTGRYLSHHRSAGPLEWGSPPKPQWPHGLPARPYIRTMLIKFGDRIAAILDGSA